MQIKQHSFLTKDEIIKEIRKYLEVNENKTWHTKIYEIQQKRW